MSQLATEAGWERLYEWLASLSRVSVTASECVNVFSRLLDNWLRNTNTAS